jgi:hypothetical protein
MGDFQGPTVNLPEGNMIYPSEIIAKTDLLFMDFIPRFPFYLQFRWWHPDFLLAICGYPLVI